MAKAIEPELLRRLINMADWMQGLGSEGQPMHVVLHTDEPIDINDATPEELPQGGHALPISGSEWDSGVYLPGGFVPPLRYPSNILPMAPLTTVTNDGIGLTDTTPYVLDELIAQVASDRNQPYWADRGEWLDHVDGYLRSLKDAGWAPPVASGVTESVLHNLKAFTTPEAAGEFIGDFIGRQAQREAEAAMRPPVAKLGILRDPDNELGLRSSAAEQMKRDAEAAADDRLEAEVVAKALHRRSDVIRIARAIRDAGRLTDTEAAHLTRLIAAGNRPEETQ